MSKKAKLECKACSFRLKGESKDVKPLEVGDICPWCSRGLLSEVIPVSAPAGPEEGEC